MRRWSLLLKFSVGIFSLLHSSRAAVGAVLLLQMLVAGCSKPIEIPVLSTGSASVNSPFTRTLIDQQLEPRDIRKILQALNKDGDLDTTVEVFDNLPDSTVTELSDWLTRWVCRDRRFAEILAGRLRHRSFSTLQTWVQKETESPGSSARHDLLLDTLNDERIVDLAKRGLRFLDPSIWAAWDTATAKVAKSYGTPAGETPSQLSLTDVATDLWRLLVESPRRQKTHAVIKDLIINDAADDLYRGLKRFHSSAPATGRPPLEGLRLGLKRMLEKPIEDHQTGSQRDNQLDLLLLLAETLTLDATDFSKTLEAGLTKYQDYIIENLKGSLQMVATHALTERIRLELIQPALGIAYWQTLFNERSETDATLELYQLVLRAWKPLIGDYGPGRSASYRLAVHLNAFVTARWLYQTLKPSLATFARFKAEQNFGEQLWAMSVQPKTLTINFAKTEGAVLTFPEKDQMMGDLQPIAELLENYVSGGQEPARRFKYDLTSDETPVAFSTAFSEILIRIDRMRNIIDAESAFRLGVQYVTEAGLNGPFTLGPPPATPTQPRHRASLLTLANRNLGITDLERVRSLNQFIFNKMGVGKLGSDLSSLVLELFSDDHEMRRKVETLLQSVQSLIEFDTPAEPELTAPFATYHAVLTAIPSERMEWVSGLLNYLSVERMAGIDRREDLQPRPHFPLFFYGVQSPMLAKTLATWTNLDGGAWSKLRLAISAFSEPDVITSDLALISDALSRHQEGWTSTWSWLGENPLPPSLTRLQHQEWLWLGEMFDDGGHATLYRFFKGASRSQWRAVAREFRGLEADGSLRKILKLLALIEDQGLRDLVTVLLMAEQSGELGSLLEIAENLL